MADNIKVAVRIRSFGPKYKGDCPLEIQGPDTILVPEKSQRKWKKMKFNRVFWSCDGHREREDGYLEPDGRESKYADQEIIFKETGEELVSHLLNGYNCTLFAYGQTGSGKSYSLMERGVNKGLLPRISCRIFKHINENDSEHNEYQISFSMLEIYNEKVYDLLVTVTKRKELKIMAFQAENLRRIPVSNPEELEGHLKVGYKNRSIAATKMNQQSSRAHTIVTIYVNKLNSEDKTKTSSEFNIVDLAGSERAAKSGTEGAQLKETGNINKSLFQLGKLIKCLSKESTRPNANYRNSKLTLLLKDSLGGNSKTVMLAAMSPLKSNYDETMSTLQYASSVKYITNKAKVNKAELLRDQGIEDVLEKLEQSKEELAKAKKEHQSDVDRLKKEIEDLRAQLSRAIAVKQDTGHIPGNSVNHDNRIKSVPHLLNLNEDHMLSKVLRFFIEKGKSLFVGGKKTNDVPDEEFIQIGNTDVSKLATIRNEDGKIFIETFKTHDVAVNGEKLEKKKKKRIKHRDRLMLGNMKALYVFMDPSCANSNLDDITFEWALDEILLRVDTEQSIAPDELALKMKVARREEDVREANARAVMLNKPLKFELQLTSAYFLGMNDRSRVVIVKVLNKKNNCRYIWTEEKFRDSLAAMNDYDETEDDDSDPFDIDCDTSYTPVGTAFIDIRPLSSSQSVPKTTLPVVDASAKNIGKISFSADICSSNWSVLNRPRRVPSENLIETPMYLKICIHQIKFEEDMGEKYTKIKCSFHLPNTTEEDDEDTEYVETEDAKGEVSIFNFTKQWKIPSVYRKHLEFFNDVLFVRVWGIPRPVAGLQVSRGNLREVTELLAEKENIIRRLKEEKRVLQDKVDDLTRAINRQTPLN